MSCLVTILYRLCHQCTFLAVLVGWKRNLLQEPGAMQAPNYVLNCTLSLTAFTMDTFNDTARDSFRGAIADAARAAYHTTVVTTIIDYQAGSVLVDASLLFVACNAAVVTSFSSSLQVRYSSCIHVVTECGSCSNGCKALSHAGTHCHGHENIMVIVLKVQSQFLANA